MRKGWALGLVLCVWGASFAEELIAPDDPNIVFQGALFFRTLEDGGLECNRFSEGMLKTQLSGANPKPGELWGGKARTTTGVKMIFKADSDHVVLHFKIPEGFASRGSNWLVCQNEDAGEFLDFPKNKPTMELKIASKTPGKSVIYTVVYPSWANPVFYGMEAKNY